MTTKSQLIILVAGALSAVVFGASGTAGADPTRPPGPGYQIAGPSGPQFPGTQVYPPRCLEAMSAARVTPVWDALSQVKGSPMKRRNLTCAFVAGAAVVLVAAVSAPFLVLSPARPRGTRQP